MVDYPVSRKSDFGNSVLFSVISFIAHQVIPYLASSLWPKKSKDTAVILETARFQIYALFFAEPPRSLWGQPHFFWQIWKLSWSDSNLCLHSFLFTKSDVPKMGNYFQSELLKYLKSLFWEMWRLWGWAFLVGLEQNKDQTWKRTVLRIPGVSLVFSVITSRLNSE